MPSDKVNPPIKIARTAFDKSDSSATHSLLAGMLRKAKHEPSAILDERDDGTVRYAIPRAPATTVTASAKDIEIPAMVGDEINLAHFPAGVEVGKATRLSTALISMSRVAKAGARIVIAPDPLDPISVDGQMAYQRRTQHFDTIEGLKFSPIADGSDVPASAIPISSVKINMGDTANLGVRVSLSRAQMRQREPDYLAHCALIAIALGLARSADKILLDAIIASEPSAFGLGAVAGQGFEFGELKSLVGTTGTGAAIGQDGTLRANGILAELSPDLGDTVIGSWGRCGVAVAEDITLIVERMSLNGDMEIIAWANMQPLLPAPGAFWLAA